MMMMMMIMMTLFYEWLPSMIRTKSMRFRAIVCINHTGGKKWFLLLWSLLSGPTGSFVAPLDLTLLTLLRLPGIDCMVIQSLLVF
jgi:hypothetical protein